MEHRDTRKLVLGTLLVGASALPAGGVLAGLLAGVGGNWIAEAVGGAISAGPPPGAALAGAFARAVQAAATGLRAAYGDERVRRDGQDAFRLLRDTARSTTAVSLPPGAADIVAVQRALGDALAQLLHGFPDAQVQLLRERLLPATARAFQAELARDPEAWRLYHAWLLERLAAQSAALQAALASQPAVRAELADAAALEERLDSFAARLDALLAELQEALLNAAARPGAPEQATGVRQLAEGGDEARIERHTQRVDNPAGPVEQIQRVGRGGVISGSSQVVTGAGRARGRRADDAASGSGGKPRDPPPIIVRLTARSGAAVAEIDWEAPVLGRRTSRFATPYHGDDLALVLRGLDLLQHPSASLGSDEIARLADLGLPVAATGLGDAAHRAVGRALFDALVADPVAATALSTVRDYATAEGRALSLHLHFPGQAQALVALPWELLWPDEALPLLCGAQPVFLTRHLDLAQAVPPPRQGGRPLRVRAVTPEAGIDAAFRVAEQRARQEAWLPLRASGTVELLPDVRPATRAALSEAARRAPADVLHVVGHGYAVDGEGHLILDGADGNWDRAPVGQLLPILAGARLAVFAACQGAAVSPDASGTALSSVATSLSAAGVPLVLGMQLTVRSAAAARLTAVLFAELAAGRSLQAALWAARRALYAEEPDGASWYVPALYVRAREDGAARLLD